MKLQDELNDTYSAPVRIMRVLFPYSHLNWSFGNFDMNWPTAPLEFVVEEFLVHLHWALGHELIIVSAGQLLVNCSELKVLTY